MVNRYDSGTIGSAIIGRASADTSPAIAAYHEGTGHALYGSTSSGYPTIGGVNDGSGQGVDGRSEQGVGVRGFTNNSDGTDGSYGVVGVQTGYSVSDSPDTFWKGGGFFGGDDGVVGLTNESGGFGVFGYNAAAASGSGYAGRFISENGNGVRISSPDGTVGLQVSGGSLAVDSSVKNAVVPTDQGERLLYAAEATEVVFADHGFGQLSNGTASIAIDPLFAQTVNLDRPYHVFVQVYGDAEVYVENRTAAGFDVMLREGDDSVAFSYRIVAKRRRLHPARDHRPGGRWNALRRRPDARRRFLGRRTIGGLLRLPAAGDPPVARKGDRRAQRGSAMKATRGRKERRMGRATARTRIGLDGSSRKASKLSEDRTRNGRTNGRMGVFGRRW